MKRKLFNVVCLFALFVVMTSAVSVNAATRPTVSVKGGNQKNTITVNIPSDYRGTALPAKARKDYKCRVRVVRKIWGKAKTIADTSYSYKQMEAMAKAANYAQRYPVTFVDKDKSLTGYEAGYYAIITPVTSVKQSVLTQKKSKMKTATMNFDVSYSFTKEKGKYKVTMKFPKATPNGMIEVYRENEDGDEAKVQYAFVDKTKTYSFYDTSARKGQTYTYYCWLFIGNISKVCESREITWN